MPARAAMCSVEVPASPRSANSIIAASRISSRRSDAVSLVVVCAMGEIVSGHSQLVKYISQRGGNPVELRLGETVVEGQRQRPRVGGVGTGKGALVGVGGETVQRVSADLGLDPLLAERGQHVVATVDLDDVGLPP